MSEKLTNFDELEDMINILSKIRSKEFEISDADISILEEILESISIDGKIPDNLPDAPEEDSENKGQFLCLEGSISSRESGIVYPSYIQFGSEGNSKYIHLEFLGLNYLMIRSNKTIFSHDFHRNLMDAEIPMLSGFIKKTSWGAPGLKTMAEILSSEKSIDLS